MDADEELMKDAIQEGNYEEVLKLYDRLYPDDIYVAEEGLPYDLCLTQKASLLSQNGKYDDAMVIYNTALTMKVSEFGEKSREAQAIYQYIGNVLLDQNQLKEALDLLNQVLENQIEILGSEKDRSKQDAFETRYLIAMVLERQGKLEEALSLYEQVYEAFSEFNGPEVDYTAHVGFTITSVKLKIAAGKNENLGLAEILEIVDYGPSVLDIKKHWEDGKDTVLHRVVRSNVANLVEIVLDGILKECGDDEVKVAEFLNFENSEVQTPLTLGVKYCCEESVKILLEKGTEHGLEVNKVTKFGENAMKIASLQSTCKNTEVIKKLLAEYNATLPLDA